MKRLYVIVLCIALLCLSLSCLGENAEHYAWDCPNCGRVGNTGNYCGGCAYPSPWKLSDIAAEAAAKLAEANEAYDNEDYEKALSLYLNLADRNDPFVLTRLGDMYYYGLGAEQDYDLSLKYNQLAADMGDATP